MKSTGSTLYIQWPLYIKAPRYKGHPLSKGHFSYIENPVIIQIHLSWKATPSVKLIRLNGFRKMGGLEVEGAMYLFFINGQ